jgi:hypothetical protein
VGVRAGQSIEARGKPFASAGDRTPVVQSVIANIIEIDGRLSAIKTGNIPAKANSYASRNGNIHLTESIGCYSTSPFCLLARNFSALKAS